MNAHVVICFFFFALALQRPFPDNDHEILPNARADRIYQAYGPLFAWTHGKRWYTGAHPVAVQHNAATVNIFELKPFGSSGCYAIPVVWSTVDQVDVVLGALATSTHANRMNGGGVTSSCQIMHLDGQTVACDLVKKTNGLTVVHVPLVRGCAVLKVCV